MGYWNEYRRNMYSAIYDSLNRSIFQCWVITYLILAALSTFVLCAESLPGFWKEVQSHSNHSGNSSLGPFDNVSSSISHRVFNRELVTMEVTVNSVYTVVWILRALTCPNLQSLIAHFPFWVNMISLSSGWIVYFSNYYVTGNFLSEPLYIRIAVVLRCLRTWRFARVFQVIRGWEIVALTLQGSMWELGILVLFFIAGMFIFSTLIYYAEYSSSESHFPNIPIGFWWAIVTMTTVGYGDIYPTSPVGYIIGAVCAIMGMFAASLSIPIISSNFSQLRHDLLILKDHSSHRKNPVLDKHGKADPAFRCPVCNTRIMIGEERKPTGTKTQGWYWK